jgi:hypothetical protein
MTDSDDLGRQVEQGVEDAGETVRAAGRRLATRAGETYDRVGEVARSGYEATAGQVATWPISSLLIAAGFGMAIGWAVRGGLEEEHRRSWLKTLYDQKRGRLLR